MTKKNLALAIASVLASTGVWAGQPGNLNPGSTTATVEAVTEADASCLLPAVLFTVNASASSGWSGAEASAFAKAMAGIQIGVAGDVELQITRHGKNGAVHQADLSGIMAQGHLAIAYVGAGARSNAWAEAYAAAAASACASTSAEAEASAAGPFGALVAGAYGAGYADSCGYGYAGGSGSGSGGGGGGAGTGAGSAELSLAGTHVYVQGANIEEFEGTIGMTSGALHHVNARAVANALSAAYAAAYASATADAFADAYAAGSIDLCLPFIGCTNIDYDDDYQDALAHAEAWASAAWAARAESQAEIVVKVLARSILDIDLGVRFENLPGTTDLLEATAESSAKLNCSAAISATLAALAEAGQDQD